MNRSNSYIPRRRRPATTEAAGTRFIDREPLDMSRLPLQPRLKIADDFVAAHPGRPIAAMLLKLFPELRGIEKPEAGQDVMRK